MRTKYLVIMSKTIDRSYPQITLKFNKTAIEPIERNKFFANSN